MSRRAARTKARVWKVQRDSVTSHSDHLATEEPLEIRLLAGDQQRSIAITMRTPGADFELAAGFLFSEGVVSDLEAIERISYCVDPALDGEQRYNIVNVGLRAAHLPATPTLERHFSITSACGVCGKASLETLRYRCAALPADQLRIAPARLYRLPDQLQAAQSVFASTGGLHAAALFDREGQLLALREDVGRHNALDKLIGWSLMQRRLPLTEQIVLVSGRASFELLQKALAAGVSLVCAISAPSSLAVDVAREFGITLVGFLRDGRFNVYSGIERILLT